MTSLETKLRDSRNKDDALHLAQSKENFVAVRRRDKPTSTAMLGANRKNADTANKPAELHGAPDGTEAKKQPRHVERGDLDTDTGRGHRRCTIKAAAHSRSFGRNRCRHLANNEVLRSATEAPSSP